mmetsp:Transcript_33133/g.59763  ORF Transcript_33133/g.59763 Transcript_33133/m.59763 type:complete len:104 (+) Transcript_33133:44-355(+)
MPGPPNPTRHQGHKTVSAKLHMHAKLLFGSMHLLPHWPGVCVDWETDVDRGNEGGHDVTKVNCLVVVTLWDVKHRRWDAFLPAKAHVCAENCNGADVEEAPAE